MRHARIRIWYFRNSLMAIAHDEKHTLVLHAIRILLDVDTRFRSNHSGSTTSYFVDVEADVSLRHLVKRLSS